MRWIGGLAGTLYLSWLLVFPELSGAVGHWIYNLVHGAFGAAAYILPLLLIHSLLRYFSEKPSGWTTTAAASLSALLAAATLLGAGIAGFTLQSQLTAALGSFGCYALAAAALLFALQAVFAVRWSKVTTAFGRIVIDDFQNWRRARRDMQAQWRQATVQAPACGKSGSQPQPLGPPKKIEDKPAALSGKTSPDAAQHRGHPSPGSPHADYKLPPVNLLREPLPDKDRGKPSDNEIAAAVSDLERTLKSFSVEARVSGYAPGPVITRYELSPAPGVKVSSIVALENDLALALKAKGIRIIAPIPGKAAVGIEIPNHKPAMVVLREILESTAALPPQAPLLSFALGLSSAGEPRSADLQKMPHILIAGATNSGKSVTIHSLILSILFRARPDEVKFLMIDPKRLELTFYDGIPHLFDPTAPAEKVAVVTSPKDASKALTALVKLMERRYEEFQLFGVRNIDSYNKEADKRGKPRAFFIVVVIDELADLMLIAQDSVEDSIQRLTQMARAVGIHLVLATQRPSVDIITGVIKANLPARLALQVISKVDSKVILDCTGAESLQGKGDLLYLAAGAQRPERCQGAYVSEDEIKAVSEYLLKQGKPDYPLLETMAKTAEADLSSFGVEPLEFSQALKLVLERRRISQDLLKSQFGSSARATNLLSLLEIKEMIYKPEGSNRWEINYDSIEAYLRQHFPQVPIK
ncbi:MAG: hypothetical protein A3J74_11400 [Elusimicrobia bacterium RIFCSPHIGHO2_02_FULL_57_9]|nr:MAG: hypothetical protein A3J74_11400 [Elusimicrobia bacterium RIFCSPHIGHO2_02_FULL_57_9]